MNSLTVMSAHEMSSDNLRGVGSWATGDKSTTSRQGLTSSALAEAKEPKGLGTTKGAHPSSQTIKSNSYAMQRFLTEGETESGVVLFTRGKSAGGHK